MSDLDDLEEIEQATRFRTSNTTDDNRKRHKRFKDRTGYARECLEWNNYSLAKPTLPKLKFLGDK